MAFIGQPRGMGLGPIRLRVIITKEAEVLEITDVTGSVIEIRDPTVITQKLAVDANGKIGVSSLPSVVLGAGTAAFGKLAANTGVDIGDVDVASIAAGDNNIGNVDIVTIPNTILAGMASLPAGTAAIGKLASNTGVDIGDVDILSIAAGNNNIGDVDIASAIPAGTNNIGDVDIASAIPAGTNTIGAVKRDVVNYTKVMKYVALANTNETTVWDPTGGTKFVITDIFVSATAAGTCTFKDGTAGTTFLVGSFAAKGGMVSNLQTPIQSTTADNNLTATASAATQHVTVCGYEV